MMATALFAPKNIKVGKGKIKSGNEVIAEYDGKGSIFRNGEYIVNIPGADANAVTLTEVNHNFYNPLLDEVHYFYEVKFSTGQSMYLRPKSKTKRMFGKDYVFYRRKLGNDIIEEILAR